MVSSKSQPGGISIVGEPPVEAQLAEQKLIELGKESLIESSVLSGQDLDDLKVLMPEIQHAMYTRTLWRTETEIRFSVLNDVDHPTVASKYHQAKLEQAVFAENLIHLSFAYRRRLLDLKETEEAIKKAEEGIGKERLEITRDEHLWALEIMRIEAQHRLREIKIWHKVKLELVEAGDGEFDVDNKDTDQLVSLIRRYVQELPVALRSKHDTAGSRNIIAHSVTLAAECERRKIAMPEVMRIKKLLKGV